MEWWKVCASIFFLQRRPTSLVESQLRQDVFVVDKIDYRNDYPVERMWVVLFTSVKIPCHSGGVLCSDVKIVALKTCKQAIFSLPHQGFLQDFTFFLGGGGGVEGLGGGGGGE